MILAVLGIMIPIIALTIPIVAILTAHQRQMAEMLRGGNGLDGQSDARILYELQCLRGEVAELKNQLNHQAIAIDNIPRLSNSAGSAGLEKVGL